MPKAEFSWQTCRFKRVRFLEWLCSAAIFIMPASITELASFQHRHNRLFRRRQIRHQIGHQYKALFYLNAMEQMKFPPVARWIVQQHQRPSTSSLYQWRYTALIDNVLGPANNASRPTKPIKPPNTKARAVTAVANKMALCMNLSTFSPILLAVSCSQTQ